jgi:hypothetical protein
MTAHHSSKDLLHGAKRVLLHRFHAKCNKAPGHFALPHTENILLSPLKRNPLKRE